MRFLKFTFILCAIGILSSCSDSYDGLSFASYDDPALRSDGSSYTNTTFTGAGDQYNDIVENPFVNVSDEPISTFSIDADGASYANVRRFIQQDNTLPPKNAVRTEELINYFDLDYNYSNPAHPINLNGEVSKCPWNTDNKLIRIGIKGKPMPTPLPASNYVFLIDVSGSMRGDDRLDLLKDGFKLLVDELTGNDRIAIVTYAGSSEVALESTAGDKKNKIKQAINGLSAGGSTAGADGIITAYDIAEENFINGGNNRIIVGTDGAFNVGISGQDDLVDLIESKRDLGIFLTILGVGRGNLNDGSLEQIANNGNGTYEYIDNQKQLKKVFIYEFSKFFTVAKDVKVQVQFNPNNVEAYRLIGYENRLLSQQDFTDDTKDAGEIGADQNITALYEIVPKNNPNYKSAPTFTIDFRYKMPDDDTSIPMTLPIFDTGNSFNQASDFMKFTSSVVSFSMLITDSQYKGTSSYNDILNWLSITNLSDNHGFKAEFKEMVDDARGM